MTFALIKRNPIEKIVEINECGGKYGIHMQI